MDQVAFDLSEIYYRGSTDPQALTVEERLVYLVQELETVADMEGWDHFFTSDVASYYGELKAGLSATGDTASLAVLKDYEHQLLVQGVPVEPEALNRFLVAQDDTYFANDRDWREDFSSLAEERRKSIRQYLGGRGIQLT